MNITRALFLCLLAGISAGAVAAPTYDVTVLTEPDPGTDHYFGGQSGTGISLSADGRTLVVGATGSGDPGKVYIFQRRLSDWHLVQELDGVEGTDVSFGSQVQISRDGKAMLIASATDVYHYANIGGIWRPNHVFKDPGQGYGFSLSMSADGEVVLIGVPASDLVFIYSLAKGTWVRTSIQDPTGSVISYYGFGGVVALSLDGTRALIGNDPYVSDTYGFAGEVYLYALSDGAWQRIYKFKNPAPQDYGDEFGQSGVGFLADGSVYIADMQRNDGSRGKVFVYRPGGSSSWDVSAGIVSPSAVPVFGAFGTPVAAAGSALLIGGSVDCIHAHYPMIAYLLRQHSAGWFNASTFADPVGCTAATDFDYFVSGGMAMDDHQRIVVISSGGSSVGALQHAGAVYIYQLQITQDWHHIPRNPW